MTKSDKDPSHNPAGRPAKLLHLPLPENRSLLNRALLFSSPHQEQIWEYLKEEDRSESDCPLPQQFRYRRPNPLVQWIRSPVIRAIDPTMDVFTFIK